MEKYRGRLWYFFFRFLGAERLLPRRLRWGHTLKIYRGVVSFGEDTAKELLLTDKKAWERYIENHIRTIAEKNGIRREHFQWAAALHREKSHPHLHVVFWDNSDEKAKIRSEQQAVVY